MTSRYSEDESNMISMLEEWGRHNRLQDPSYGIGYPKTSSIYFKKLSGSRGTKAVYYNTDNNVTADLIEGLWRELKAVRADLADAVKEKYQAGIYASSAKLARKLGVNCWRTFDDRVRNGRRMMMKIYEDKKHADTLQYKKRQADIVFFQRDEKNIILLTGR